MIERGVGRMTMRTRGPCCVKIGKVDEENETHKYKDLLYV